VQTAIENPKALSEQEWNALLAVLLNSKGGKEIIQGMSEGLPDQLKELMPDLETVEIPHPPSCAWIGNITEGHHCDQCDLCNVIQTPLDLGFGPWTTKKRTMLLVGNLDEEILVAEAILAGYPEIFYQGERLVRVVGNPLKAVSGSQQAPLEVQSITPANLQEMLSSEFVFLKIDGDRVRTTYPPAPLVHGLLDRAKYPSLKHLRGITEVPVLRLDGTVLQEAGYDRGTELLYQPQRAFPKVPDLPSPGEVQAALYQLLDVVSDFPFVNDLGKAVFLATILTVVGRFAFQGCVPLVLIDANTPGVGKTKLADTIGIITTNQPLPRATQMKSDWEERKQITSILLKGERLLLIDNIGSRFGSPVLDALLTSEIWQDRIVGRSQQVTAQNLLQVITTGNNMQLKADTVRRCIRIQLTTQDEHPESRSEFRHPDLEAWVAEHQPELLTAALTLLRGYMVAGKPQQDLVTLGSFAGWSNLVQATVKWAYGVDPGLARVTSDDEMDLDQEIMEKLMRGWRNIVPEGSAMSARKVMDTAQNKAEVGRDIFEALEMGNASGKRTPVALGRLLTRYRKRTHQGACFDYKKSERNAEGIAWRLMTL